MHMGLLLGSALAVLTATGAAAEALRSQSSCGFSERVSPWVRPIELAQQRCCKRCSKGKACGNTCISAKSTCRQPPGCACDG